MPKIPKKIPVRVRKTVKRKQDCLNLRTIEKKRWEKILAQAVDVVDLPKLTARYRATERREEKKKREQLISQAQHLLDLSLKEKKDLAETSVVPSDSIKEKFATIEIDLRPDGKKSQSLQEEVISRQSAPIFSPPSASGPGELIFPDEFSENVEIKESFAVWSTPIAGNAIDKTEGKTTDFNFLAPSGQAIDEKKKKKIRSSDGFCTLGSCRSDMSGSLGCLWTGRWSVQGERLRCLRCCRWLLHRGSCRRSIKRFRWRGLMWSRW